MPEPETNENRGKILRILLPVAAVVLVAGILIYLHASHYESTDDAFIDAHIVPVSPKVAGQISKVFINDNQPVKQNDPLVEIDPRDYTAKLEEQKAKVAAAEAEAARATADAARYKELYKRDAVSKQQLDLANANAKSAQAVWERERAAEATAELNLSYTHLVAPDSGHVTKKSVEPGAYVQVGQPLLSIVPDEVWVTANFKETQLTYMRPGQPVRIKIDAYPGHVFHGHVDSIQAGTGERFSLLPPENATGNYVKVVQRIPVKIVFDQNSDPDHLLAPGMSVVPRVEVK